MATKKASTIFAIEEIDTLKELMSPLSIASNHQGANRPTDLNAQSGNAQPKTISTIDVNVLTPAIGVNDYKAKFVEDYNFCPLCGDELLFTHVTQFIQGQVEEEAHCESCHIRTKKNLHELH